MIDRDVTALQVQLAALSSVAVAALACEALGDPSWTTPTWTRFAYVTFAALKHGCLLIWLVNVLDAGRRGALTRVLGQPLEAHLRQPAVVLEHLLHLLDEALALLEVI